MTRASINTTAFITKAVTFQASTAVYPTLYINPGGTAGPGWINLQMPSQTTPQERLEIADRLVSAATQWRDDLAEAVEKERTTADELAEARTELARLREQLGHANTDTTGSAYTDEQDGGAA